MSDYVRFLLTYLCVLQATGVRIGMMLQAVACVGVGLAIGFIYSWKFTLFILGIVPIMLMASAIQLKLAKGFSGKNKIDQENAGKVKALCLIDHQELVILLLHFCLPKPMKKIINSVM